MPSIGRRPGDRRPAAAQNLAVNGSFEAPAQVPNGYTDYQVGSSAIPGWTIVGVRRTCVSVVDSMVRRRRSAVLRRNMLLR